MKVQLFLVSLVVSLVESTGDIVMSVKGFASFTIIVFLATEVAMYSAGGGGGGGGGGEQGQFAPGLQYEGDPIQC